MSAGIWTPAYVALGSNLDAPQMQVERAFALLEKISSTLLVGRSALYRSQPMGPQDQPEFVNAAAGLLTQLDALQLLVQLQGIEREMGRTAPAYRWGPRIIDLDLLVYGASRYDSNPLRVPHPGIRERNFVLFPLRDIAPELEIPGMGRVRDLAARIGDVGLAAIH